MLANLSILHGRITIVEVAWTLIGLLGIAINILNYRDAMKDLQVLLFLEMNGYMKAIAKAHARTNLLRLTSATAVMFAGIIAMFQGAPNPHKPVSITGLIVTVALFYVVVVNNVNGVLDRRLRHKLMRLPHNGVSDPDTGENHHA